jgi:hypothetical protein
MNTIRTIRPYKYFGQWVFDDPTYDLVREAFAAGTDDVIDHATAHTPDAEKGFLLLFSDTNFPSATIEMIWLRGGLGEGDVYSLFGTDLEGWLCPTLIRYFPSPPKSIFAQVKPSRN